MSRARSRDVRGALCAAVFVLGFASVGAAQAQTRADGAVEGARTAFLSGTEAMRTERWEEARVSFARAYELAPNPLVLLNLAAAELHTGHLASAARHYRGFMRGANDGASQSYRDAAAEALGSLEPRIPVARLAVGGLEAGDRLELDGESVARMSATSELQVDPGEHRVVVVRAGAAVASATFTAEESRTVDVSLRAPASARAAAARVVTVPPPPGADRSVSLTDDRASDHHWVGSTGFWILVTGVAVTVAAVVLVLAAVASTGPPNVFVGNLGPIPVS